jgi:hypothetical protein
MSMSRHPHTIMKTRTFRRDARLDGSREKEGQGAALPRELGAPGTRYERIMRVSIKHRFYNSSKEECRDFAMAPTSTTVSLMRRLGLLFKDEGTGFSVLYNKNHETSLLEWLKRQKNKDKQLWTRFSFVLTSNNPYFVNRTKIPINTNASTKNFYFTNQDAHRPEGGQGKAILNPNGYVSEESQFEVANTQVAIEVSDDTSEVEVCDVSNEVVLRKSRYEEPNAAMEGASKVMYLDMAHLPEDLYTIRCLSREGDPIGTDLKVVYHPMSPSPLCLINLLFTNPTGEPEGIYPVASFDSGNSISPVHYELVFKERSTFWNYYIIPRGSKPLEGLRIVNLDPGPSAPCYQPFDGPCCVRLANGAKAYRFVSKEPLQLVQQPQVRFQLQGRRSSLLGASDILMDRLPAASVQQVLPMRARQVCCAFRQSEPDLESPGCRELQKCLCPEPYPPDDDSSSAYSDIFVYV